MRHLVKIITLILAIALCSCHRERQYFPKDINNVNVEIVRFDNTLLSLPKDSAGIYAEMSALAAQNSAHFQLIMEDIFGIYAEDLDYFCSTFPLYLNDTLYGFQEINQQEQTEFSHISDIQNELNTAFSRLHFLYPEMPVPTIYFAIGGWDKMHYINVLDEANIIVYADMYLGSEYEQYNNKDIHHYRRVTMSREYMVVDILNYYLSYITPFTSDKSRLLENMIYKGKIMYLLRQLLPEKSNYEICKYTPEEYAICEKNELEIWRLILDKQDLFRSESMLLKSYMDEGPFTSEISQDCPARVGAWIGMRIVSQYMQNNQEIGLIDLMTDGDAQKILQHSNYKP